MKRTIIAAVAAVLLAALPASAAVSQPVNKLTCTGEINGGTYKSVRVPAGADCTLNGVTVIGNVFAKKAPGSVRILSSEVGHNIMIDGATGLVHIGVEGCRVDPHAGNNIKVTNSTGDILICEETIDNNLMLRGNSGAISVFRNTVGVNIQVMHNLAYAGTSTHGTPGAIRVRGNTVTNRLVVRDNDGRPAVCKNNTAKAQVCP